MDTLRLCTQCREPLPAETTERVCPRCHSDPGRTTPPSVPGQRPPPPTPAEIAQFFPQLEILELIGHGGMGMVYKVRQPQLDRVVALKILSPELSGDLAFAERFSREAQSMAKLNHSNLIGIFDFGRAGSFYYFLMEYVDGVNLHTLIQGGQLGPQEARRIVMEICHALQYAHEEGVVHRDIKPSNILIDKRGRVKIADFGLAKLARNDGQRDSRLTLTTMVMGTPHYMAPEQIETPAAVDHRADLYSLGVVFYEMLTGELPLGRFQPPSHKSIALDARLDDVVLRTLEKDPNRRYQQAMEIRAAVETATSQVQTIPSEILPVTRPPRNWSFLRQPLLMIGTAALTAFFFLLMKDHGPGRQTRPKTPPPVTQIDFTAGPEVPVLGHRVISELQLTKEQIPEVTRLIRRFEREFVGLERRHTEHSQDDRGHVHITVKPFPADIDKLMDHMWTDLGVILSADQMKTAHTVDFNRFFPNTGRNTVKVEIWKDQNGTEHYVESENPGPNGQPPPLGTQGLSMPPRYRFYLPENQ